MSLYSPIFDQRGILIARLLDNKFVCSLTGKSLASVQPDGGVLSDDMAVHYGGFHDHLFFDVNGLPVAFVDRSRVAPTFGRSRRGERVILPRPIVGRVARPGASSDGRGIHACCSPGTATPFAGGSERATHFCGGWAQHKRLT